MAQKPLPATPKNIDTICTLKREKITENTYKKDNQEHYVKKVHEDTTADTFRKCEQIIYQSGWWFQPSWKILVSGMDYIVPYMKWKIKFMFQTANQQYMYYQYV